MTKVAVAHPTTVNKPSANHAIRARRECLGPAAKAKDKERENRADQNGMARTIHDSFWSSAPFPKLRMARDVLG
jgi:hypothetical protein